MFIHYLLETYISEVQYVHITFIPFFYHDSVWEWYDMWCSLFICNMEKKKNWWISNSVKKKGGGRVDGKKIVLDRKKKTLCPGDTKNEVTKYCLNR